MQEHYSNSKIIDNIKLNISKLSYTYIRISEKYIVVLNYGRFNIYDHSYNLIKKLSIESGILNLNYIIYGDYIYYIGKCNGKINKIIKHDILNDKCEYFEITFPEYKDILNLNLICENNILYIHNYLFVFKFDIINNTFEVPTYCKILKNGAHVCPIITTNNLLYCGVIKSEKFNNILELYLMDLNGTFYSEFRMSEEIVTTSKYINIITNLHDDIIISDSCKLIIYRNGKKFEHKLKSRPYSNVIFDKNYIMYITNDKMIIKEEFPNLYQELK